jgi:hypothetical protein
MIDQQPKQNMGLGVPSFLSQAARPMQITTPQNRPR